MFPVTAWVSASVACPSLGPGPETKTQGWVVKCNVPGGGDKMALVWMDESLDCDKQVPLCGNLGFPDIAVVLLPSFSAPFPLWEQGKPPAPP